LNLHDPLQEEEPERVLLAHRSRAD